MYIFVVNYLFKNIFNFFVKDCIVFFFNIYFLLCIFINFVVCNNFKWWCIVDLLSCNFFVIFCNVCFFLNNIFIMCNFVLFLRVLCF